MKILCVCEGGAVRSASLANHLKHVAPHHDALACAWRYNSPETLELLCTWAELIVVMQPNMILHIPPSHRGRTKVCDVGPDLYGFPMCRELIEKVSAWARAEKLTDEVPL